MFFPVLQKQSAIAREGERDQKLLVSSVGSAEVQLFLAVTHVGVGLSVMQLPLNHLPSYQ